MMTQQYDNSGALFKNDRKQTQKHPDYTGSVIVDGQEFWISAWLKTSSKGTKFMSLAFTEKQPVAAQTPTPAPSPAPASDDFDDFADDIPF